jgi:hypothetical protein
VILGVARPKAAASPSASPVAARATLTHAGLVR